MNEVTRQTEDLFVNGEFSQIIFIPIVSLRREGKGGTEKLRALLFNIYFTVILKTDTHQKCQLLLLKQRLQNRTVSWYKSIEIKRCRVENSDV